MSEIDETEKDQKEIEEMIKKNPMLNPFIIGAIGLGLMIVVSLLLG